MRKWPHSELTLVGLSIKAEVGPSAHACNVWASMLLPYESICGTIGAPPSCGVEKYDESDESLVLCL